MRSTLIVALFGLSLLPATAQAQSDPQTAAGGGGVTREQYLQRAQDRAAQRAGARFDQMDANHDGILDRTEVRAWRSQHSRRAAAQAAQPTAQ